MEAKPRLPRSRLNGTSLPRSRAALSGLQLRCSVCLPILPDQASSALLSLGLLSLRFE